MKELSIEEKARAYDRALAKAKEEAIDGYLDAVAVNDIFPEIIDGEDERIRENCIHFLELQKSHHASTVEIEECIAWLEQGEQKPNYCHHEVDLSRCSKEYRKAYYDGWNNCNMQHSQCNSEKNDVIKCLINGMKFYYDGNEEATWGTDKWSMPVKHIIEVLENLGEQKPADKIEEDEELMKWSINNLIELKDRFGEEYGKVGECINWIKSLKDRVQPLNQWKPSNDQMEALDFAADCIVPDEFCFKRKALKELLEQLKNL